MKFKLLQGIPGVGDLKLFGVISGKFSYLIVQGKEGFVASYKDREFQGKQSSSYINNGDHSSLVVPFQTFKEAVEACKRQRKLLRRN